ncbi:MAG TPA: hypothetical protein VKY90_09615 [Candidatus Dormibacteraeota bacterium]|nr:hypothetical protein [Candidatus Dormibacteraeota bacterium]
MPARHDVGSQLTIPRRWASSLTGTGPMGETQVVARTAVTLSISMPAPTRRLLDDLREGRSVSEYVRRLVEQDAARRLRRSPTQAGLEEVGQEPPRSWRRQQPDLLEPTRSFPSVAELVGASVLLGDLGRTEPRPAER